MAKATQSMGTGWLGTALEKHSAEELWRGDETDRTATEKLRLSRTCVGEAGQSRGEEVLYNALELNSNRFYNKGDN